ncbi:MAG: carbon-nitrogen hydrolase family protein [Proteobacteria bacterium]|nr:MAG: carbon-nitrogen hydrolase family protein [Pseudomonadota bacterium]
MGKIAALQLPTLPMNEAKLDYYARICDKKDIRLVVLGEYVLNSFFKELEKMSKNMIKEQSTHKIKMLQNICKKYNLTIIAPIIRVINGKFEKSILKASAKSMRYYPQYFFINFKHWNEEKFFHQEDVPYNLPTLTHEGLKYALIMGYELHFDYIWEQIDKKRVDGVLIPSVSTFSSKQRWDEMLRCRAFTHNVYILRVNRIGMYKESRTDWYFYGNTALIDPHGEIENNLHDEEAMLVADLDKNKVNEARNLWGWRKALSKKGLL